MNQKAGRRAGRQDRHTIAEIEDSRAPFMLLTLRLRLEREPWMRLGGAVRAPASMTPSLSSRVHEAGREARTTKETAMMCMAGPCLGAFTPAKRGQ